MFYGNQGQPINPMGFNPYMQGQMYGQQPMFNNQFAQQQSRLNGVRFVSGIEEVNSSMVPPGTGELFMDMNREAFYIKETGTDGISSVEEFEYRKSSHGGEHEYVTKNDFDQAIQDLRSQYESAFQQIRHAAAESQHAVQQPSSPAKPAGQHETAPAVYQNNQSRPGETAGRANNQGTGFVTY